VTVTWVVGAGGLLGRHVVSALRKAGDDVLTREIPWHDTVQTGDVLRAGIRTLREAAAGDGWAVAWCAGAGVVATPKEALEAEVAVFQGFLRDLSALGEGGSLFLASSAGGVYAGSDSAPPFTERSSSRALAPYGHAKLAMEDHARAFAESSGSRVLIGRIANLYGPGQNLAKPQGLVSLLCQAQLSGQPLPVFVSLDTLRDYLFVEDAAAMVVAGLARVADQSEPVVTKIMASGRGTSVAALVGEATHVFRRRPPIVYGASPVAAHQVRDLRLSSVVWPEIDRLARTPLAVGLAATGSSIARGLARNRLTSDA
jgi:UDP-glucose 4-epimerase